MSKRKIARREVARICAPVLALGRPALPELRRLADDDNLPPHIRTNAQELIDAIEALAELIEDK